MKSLASSTSKITITKWWLSVFAALSLAACTQLSSHDFRPSFGTENTDSNIEVYSQVDSVIASLSQTINKNQQLDSLLLYTDRVLNHDEQAAFRYATAANKIATEKNLSFKRGLSFYYLSLILGRKEFDKEGIDRPFFYAQFSKRLFEEANNPYWNILSNIQIGDLYRRKAELDSAENYFSNALSIVESKRLESSDSLKLRANILHEMGTTYYSRKEIEKAEQFYTEAHLVYQQTNESAAFLRLQSDLSLLYIKQKRYESADSLLKKCIIYADSLKDNNSLSRLYENISLLRLRQYDLSNGIEKYRIQSIDYANIGLQLDNKDKHIFYNQKGVAFYLQLFYVKSDAERILISDSAISNYNKAFNYASKVGEIKTTRDMVPSIIELCDYRNTSLKVPCDGILNTSIDNFINDSYGKIIDNIGDDLKGLNQQIVKIENQEIINQESKNRLIQQIIGAGIFLIATLVFLLLYQQLQKKRLSAKMEALRAQINPHFISNSLNAIENLVNQDQKEAAAKYLIHFSRFSRKILNSSRQSFTSLANELGTIEHFLALEQLRFRDKLAYEVIADKQIDTNSIQVPSMILQPYVENAIWHGLKPKSEAGTLLIRLSQDGKDLLIAIEDNGVGRVKSQELQASSVLGQKRKSQGMQITYERLKSMGRVKGKHVEIVDLYDDNDQAIGTKVILRIPLTHKKKA
ncbi:MAG: histidine kinase [Bacteroidia bacterium]